MGCRAVSPFLTQVSLNHIQLFIIALGAFKIVAWAKPNTEYELITTPLKAWQLREKVVALAK